MADRIAALILAGSAAVMLIAVAMLLGFFLSPCCGDNAPPLSPQSPMLTRQTALFRTASAMRLAGVGEMASMAVMVASSGYGALTAMPETPLANEDGEPQIPNAAHLDR
jgi:hypothetical protein